MSDAMIYIGLAVIIVGLIPIVPKMMTLRIKFFRFLHWNWLANLHEKYYNGIVIAVRCILLAIAIVLLILGLTDGDPSTGSG